ncbi:Meromycolate extension acyl carrier protein [Corynebacterium occultum]|uniref:Acyl carrier protein n=1 Tax=Corynebacterium occultum TaxID=2675219 RepID=A0A6B8WD39_9CORY|nr:acyl carrier protein [Corynebacterium occultum]QGU07900.1 Meromycolate extension acyl carrier protein [Corynebacterium occultum]
MTTTELQAELAKIFQDYAGVEAADVVPEARIIEDLAVNSLSLVEITIRIEEAFGVQLEDKHVMNFQTIGDLIGHLEAERSPA